MSHRVMVRKWWEPVVNPAEMPWWWLFTSSALAGIAAAFTGLVLF